MLKIPEITTLNYLSFIYYDEICKRQLEVLYGYNDPLSANMYNKTYIGYYQYNLLILNNIDKSGHRIIATYDFIA